MLKIRYGIIEGITGRTKVMGTDIRETSDAIVVHTDAALVERKLKKLKAYIYSMPYYDAGTGKVIGVDMFFEKSARPMLRRIVNGNQLPLL